MTTEVTAEAMAEATAKAMTGAVAVIGHSSMLSLSIAKWRNLLNSQSPVYDGDRQAPPDLLNLFPEGTDPDPDEWLTRHKSILSFPRSNASASSNRRSFGSKRYFQSNS